MNSNLNLSAAPKKEWIKPEVKGFELNKTEGGRWLDSGENTYYHT